MAAYMRSVLCLFPIELGAFLTRGNGIIVKSQRYVRGLRRKPVRVLFSDTETGKVVKAPPTQGRPAEQDVRKKGKEVKVTSTAKHDEESGFIKAKSNVRSTTQHAHVVTKDQIDGLHFERAFPGDKRLARLVSVARSRTFREHQGKIVLEGRRLICDALDAGASPQTVFFSMVDRLRELPLDKLKRATLVKVKFEDIKIWSDLVAPQGVIAIFSRPDPSRLNFANRGHSVPLSLICDNIRDPGNLGTMLRSAAAAGCHNVLLTKGCVDAWEPKVLRAAMGAHFRLPIFPSLNWDDIENHLPTPVTVHVADSSCDAGRSRETEDSQINKEKDYDSEWESEDEGLSLPRVDAKRYHESWAQSPTALVIGGETHGLSVEAVQLAEKTAGHRLFIPVVPDMDSLNSAMAASILLFEGRKQLLKLMQTSEKKLKSQAER
uniref:RNA 2-O ribose methyltransferase substrate binding domain-containing protein n=1 Tax=Monopterus albus TaxID=43700 RepID=A0A3Q3JVY6_MONAL|nr:rRNA methyltransferase 3, mitochondrial [Monopterus albus]